MAPIHAMERTIAGKGGAGIIQMNDSGSIQLISGDEVDQLALA